MVSFIATALLTFGAIINGYLSDSLPDTTLNRLDRFVLGKLAQTCRTPWQRIKVALGQAHFTQRQPPDPTAVRTARKRRQDALRRFVLALSDQQLVTGLAILIAGYIKRCSMSQYHFNIVKALAWFSSTIHLSTPDPIATPEDVPTPAAMPDVPPPIPTLSTQEELQSTCLGARSSTCLLALLPSHHDASTVSPEAATSALASLAALAKKHADRHAKIFPFYAIPAKNPGAEHMREVLGLKGDGEMELVAVNARRIWWKRYEREGYGIDDIESWVDAIRLGEGKKEKLPDGIVAEEEEKHEEHDEL